jgi:hypothetical protein
VEKREWLINNGYSIIGFLPVNSGTVSDNPMPLQSHSDIYSDMTSPFTPGDLEQTATLTSTSDGREHNMLALHTAMRVALQRLESVVHTGFPVCIDSTSKWNCFPVLISYCCDIIEAKNITVVKHGLSGCNPCHRCLATPSDMLNCETGVPRHRIQTLNIRSEVARLSESLHSSQRDGLLSEQRSNKKAIAEVLNKHSLAAWPSFLESSRLVDSAAIPDLYSIFTFELLHNLYLGCSVRLKELLLPYLSSPLLATIPTQRRKKTRLFSSLRTAVLRGCNTILSVFQDEYITSATRVDFSKKEASSQLNGIYTSAGVRGMLEGKDHKNLDAFFPFVFSYVDVWLGYENKAPLTMVYTMYVDIVNKLTTDNFGNGWTADDRKTLRDSIHVFKKLVSSVFRPHFENSILTLKFHLLDHVVDDLERFGSIKVLSASPFEHFNLNIKQAYAKTSRRYLTRSRETFNNLDGTLKRRRITDAIETSASDVSSKGRDPSFGLVSSGHSIPFHCLHLCAKGHTIPIFRERDFLSNLQESFSSEVFSQLADMIHDEIQSLNFSLLPNAVKINFVQSGYVKGGFLPTLRHCASINGNQIIRHDDNYTRLRQRVFGISWSRKDQRMKQSFVLLRANEDNCKNEVWVAKVLLLLSIVDSSTQKEEQYAFVRFFIVTTATSEVDKALQCVCLRWETDEDIDRTLQIDKELEQQHIEAGEWFGLVPFSSILGTVQVLRSNIPVKPLSDPLPWPLHRFYINRFTLPKDVPVNPENDSSFTSGFKHKDDL